MRYRKKPVAIEAMRFMPETLQQCVTFCSGTHKHRDGHDGPPHGDVIEITTLEGTMMAIPGDWIIQGVKGEFYPCKPDVFEATYEFAHARKILIVLLEYSEAKGRVVVRGVWPKNDFKPIPPLMIDNVQNYIEVFEGCDHEWWHGFNHLSSAIPD